MNRPRGFTLLEMLVVLLIAGMALALTTQALGQYQRAHARALASERNGRELRMVEAWFTDGVRGLYPAASGDTSRNTLQFGRNAGTKPFQGDAKAFTGTTLAPVLAGQGVPVEQTWAVALEGERGPRLRLEEEGHRLELPLPPAADARFHYLDAKGKVHPSWPPSKGAWPQLPDAVVLELVPLTGVPQSGGVVVAAVLGPRDPYRNPFEYEEF